jgi:tRNA pseudouridine38-40 synthase
MRRVALKVAYIGTDFHGFQRQPDLNTVEGELIGALKKVGLLDDLSKCGYRIAGRTDKGVHALGNVISFITGETVIINQINDALPNNIRVLAHTNVPWGFKPRFAKNRHYRYIIVDDLVKNPDFDLKEMKMASQVFKGTHNFRNFSKRGERNPLRTINEVSVRKSADTILVDIWGESFLWKMVRKMVAVLVEVAEGQLKVDDICKYFDFDPLNPLAIKPLPPEGLILMDVLYEGLEFQEDSYAKKKFLIALKEHYFYQRIIATVEKEMIRSLNKDF